MDPTLIAYLTNQFPSPVEPYVGDEVMELRKRGAEVIPCSARLPAAGILTDEDSKALAAETLYLEPLRIGLLVRAAWLCVCRFNLLADLFLRVLAQGSESPGQRFRALLHTWLGAYYALKLEGRGVEHIHVHHGYFASWVAMIAARLLGIGFSVTLHGSDLFLRRAYLDTKLKHCQFCLTVSEFNRNYILENYPGVAADKVIMQRMGVSVESCPTQDASSPDASQHLILLAVGRLHPVKNHAFLLLACHQLKRHSLKFLCWIAGEGPERTRLERMIKGLSLNEDVKLLGHLAHPQLKACYESCDVVVLTSHSEGVPVVLMEAMALGKIVLAPAITGIPELVVDGKTGFLYRPGAVEDLVARIEDIRRRQPALGPLREAARQHVVENFNRERNLRTFADLFLKRIPATRESIPHENSVLQQI